MKEEFSLSHLLHEVRYGNSVVGYGDCVVRVVCVAGTHGHEVLHRWTHTLRLRVFGPDHLQRPLLVKG